ncbi:hypothetical protein JNX00_12340 [Hydrogenophaga sp. YM1]|uniref:hypothetical protein n=1 Tax=Hydrogenophaga sp. YM1 TaxID=2806262 RepID=UPI00195E5AED|nr:hypothetical protein [Hydrogenophaga sp. YM1]QRR32476.1 hypothetical protein JNX00_12340 [Hydrogenophaga sp. YM1]
MNDVRADVVQLMRTEAERRSQDSYPTAIAQRHPLGFFACKWALGEGRSLRLHLWSKAFEWAQEPGWEIHDHVFSFSSLLLEGSLRNRVYRIDETPSARGEYSIYEVFYNGSESSMKLIREGVGLKVCADTEESPGTIYSLDAGVLHSSELVSEQALTVLATLADDTSPVVPRVVSAHRHQSVAFDRSPPPDSQVADLLAKFGQYLEDTR